ncbi:MAG: DUF4082 domain-containing protein [Pseudonocardia sediminis]
MAAEAAGLFADQAPRRVQVDPSRSSVELGVRFRTSAAGTVTGAQVYKLAKGPGKTPRRASLWSPGGKRLATAMFERQRGAGWVQVSFSQAVEVKPGRTYTVSVFAPHGHYAVTERGLRKTRTRGVLSSAGGPNGVYRYGGSSRFPDQSYRSSNYWVDVLFRRGGTAPTTPTAPTSPTPPATGFPDASNTGVPAGVALSAYTGPRTITTPGTVIDAKQITGGLDIRTTDVMITRSSVTGNVDVSESGSLSISDTFIDAGDRSGTGLGAYNYTAIRVHVIGGNRSMLCVKNCTIRDSYVHGQMIDEGGTNHESGIRMEQNTTLIHNTIGCDAPTIPPDAGCSAGLTGYGDFAPVQNNLIQNNLFLPTPGGACAYGGSSAGKPYSDGARDIRFIDNVFSRGKTGKCGYWFPIADFDSSAPGNVWQGNVWDDGGTVRP